MLPLNQNSRAGHLNVLGATDCKTLLASKDQLEAWNALRPEIDSFKVLVIPELEYFLKVEETKTYPFNLSWEDIKDDVMLILHTSGSTGTFCSAAEELKTNLTQLGLPKPIEYTNHMLVIYATGDVANVWGGLKTLVPLPPS